MSLFASGSEVEIALAAQKILEAEGTPTRVVSVPCFELFARQSEDARKNVIGDAPVRVAVEAGLAMGWDLFLGSQGCFVGMTGFRRQRALQGALSNISGSTPAPLRRRREKD